MKIINCKLTEKLFIVLACGIFLIIISALTSCKKEIFWEHEPNNTFDHANMIEVDRPMRGYLSSSNDIDNFFVDIAEPGSFDIQISPVKGVNTSISVFQNETPDPLLLKIVDDSRKSSPERVKNIWLNRGRYYFTISHGDRDIPKGETDSYYELKLSVNSRTGNEEHEPNDTFESANPLIDNQASGYFSPAFYKNASRETSSENDFFKFDIEAAKESPKIINITLSEVPDITPVVELYDQDKTLLTTGKALSAGMPVSISGLGVVKPGTYYIKIYSSNYESNNDKLYHLKVELSDFDKSFELEPNNTLETAVLMSTPEMKGSLFPQDDRDFIQIPNSEPSMISVEASFSNSVDGILTLFSSDGKKIFEVNSAGPGKKEIISPVYSASDIFVMVSGINKTISADNKYTLTYKKEPFTEGLEIEPNDSIKYSQKIDNKIKGYLNYKKDRDVYLLESSSRATKSFRIKGIDRAVFTVSLTDSHGYILRTEKVTSQKGISFRDMIDGKAYLIIDSERDIQNEPYYITIGDK